MLACLQEIELYPYSIFYKFESNVRTRKLWNATVNHPTQVLETPVSALFPFMLSRNFETRSTTYFALRTKRGILSTIDDASTHM